MIPIVILGTPRSFTSLTTGIFRDHGVWTGRCKEYTEWCPTGSVENAAMKRILKANRNGGCVAKGMVVEPIKDFKEKILSIMSEEGYTDGPCVFKHSAMFYRAWEEFNPKFICCRRPKDKVVKSGERSGMYAANENSWEKHQNIMSLLVNEGKAVNVWGEEFFKGDWGSLEKAFEFCDLEFNQKIAENLINHKHKHF